MQARATYTGRNGLWHGAIKVGGKVVWTCGHNHHNRDQGSRTWGRAACECSKSALRYALMTDAEIEQVKADVRAYMNGGMSPRAPWTIDFELSAREQIRAALNV